MSLGTTLSWCFSMARIGFILLSLIFCLYHIIIIIIKILASQQ
jgi:hypothetical protein